MKLCRLGQPGREIPCVLDAKGTPRDVSGIVPDFGPSQIAAGLVERLAGVDRAALPVVPTEGRRIGPPVAQPRNIWCIGLNYSDHAAEAGLPIPDEPILFTKASATFCGPTDPIPFSPRMSKLDWEVELGVVIGRAALEVSEEDALDHVLGYTVVNDVSERVWQQERGGQWVKGKSYPNFCPTGPWLVTRDEVADPQALALWLDVNDAPMQRGSTASMIFSVRRIVSYMSQFCRLEPGDLICTGTPPGVGAGLRPPRFLRPGDRVTLGIEGLGSQGQTVVASAGAAE